MADDFSFGQTEQAQTEQSAASEHWQAKYLGLKQQLHTQAETLAKELSQLREQTGQNYQPLQQELTKLQLSLSLLDVQIQTQLSQATEIPEGARLDARLQTFLQEPIQSQSKNSVEQERTQSRKVLERLAKRREDNDHRSHAEHAQVAKFHNARAVVSYKEQVQISDDELKEELAESGETKEPSQKILEPYRPPKVEVRAVNAIQALRDRETRQAVEKRFAQYGLLADGDKIEGQQVDFIRQGDKIAVTFKLTAAMKKHVIDTVLPQIPEPEKRPDRFAFTSYVQGQDWKIGDCCAVTIDTATRLLVALDEERELVTEADLKKPIFDKKGAIIGYKSKEVYLGEPARAVAGMVRIETAASAENVVIAERIAKALQRLDFEKALVAPDAEAERAYKKARVMWQQRIPDEAAYQAYADAYYDEVGEDVLDHLVRQEVYPGYFTMVDPGASERYMDQDPLYISHYVSNIDNIPAILTSGLLSSAERYKRGMLISGMSTTRDFMTGGADNVFLRCTPESAGNQAMMAGLTPIMIDPAVLDRTDWYAYDNDHFGTISPDLFNKRPDPMSFFKRLRQDYYNARFNEVMMRRAVSPEAILAVNLGKFGKYGELQRREILKRLAKNGVREIHGRPPAAVFTTFETFEELTAHMKAVYPQIYDKNNPEANDPKRIAAYIKKYIDSQKPPFRQKVKTFFGNVVHSVKE